MVFLVVALHTTPEAFAKDFEKGLAVIKVKSCANALVVRRLRFDFHFYASGVVAKELG